MDRDVALAYALTVHKAQGGEYKVVVELDTDKYSFKEPRVVTFGGSYPGMLAGWARLKFPHLVKASVASSAPINAVLNYRGYYEVVGKALGNQSVGGSAACVDAVESAFEELGKKLDTESGRMDIAKAFDICGNADGGGDSLAIAANKGLLVATLSNLFPAQSNDPACDAANCNIEKVCASMTESIDIEKFVKKFPGLYARTIVKWRRQKNSVPNQYFRRFCLPTGKQSLKTHSRREQLWSQCSGCRLNTAKNDDSSLHYRCVGKNNKKSETIQNRSPGGEISGWRWRPIA